MGEYIQSIYDQGSFCVANEYLTFASNQSIVNQKFENCSLQVWGSLIFFFISVCSIIIVYDRADEYACLYAGALRMFHLDDVHQSSDATAKSDDV